MAKQKTDIVIFGAGIAGLWLLHSLKKIGYDVLLAEKNTIGGQQSMASQGIIHSGLKYALAGHVNKLAKSISDMPERWRMALKGEGNVDLSSARIAARSQLLLIPEGFMGGIVNVLTKKTLGDHVRALTPQDWPEELKTSGFRGRAIFMDELVLDIDSTVRALARPYQEYIRKINSLSDIYDNIEAQLYIYTAAQGNEIQARERGDDKGLQTQARPLLMGFLKPAPFALYAHLVSSSEKPVATITTHETSDGKLVWYLGGGVAERPKDAEPESVYKAIEKAFARYLPDISTGGFEWATLPIDRIEGKSDKSGWMPDTPTIHPSGDHLYCWPTKLTFAPMLAENVLSYMNKNSIKPQNKKADFSFFPEADFSPLPWDHLSWTKRDSQKRGSESLVKQA